jgi:hypothetical protein
VLVVLGRVSRVSGVISASSVSSFHRVRITESIVVMISTLSNAISHVFLPL